ncbi:thioesterase family protein [uncultured Microbacterium sp.]|uniref:thioesterase family protein n=1 Tax=uncultured Microbacterium sp. TaxID=191216 RepID=UPI0028D6C902|nr:thioesterase family protein [uncultured Microbacterium sp.]
MTAYFERLSDRSFRATEAVQGAWNTSEQHIAPTIGLLAHLVETHRDGRRDDGLALARVSYDILGVLPIDVVEVDLRVIRPGRTIELVEATLSHAGRPAVILRAWLMQTADTSSIAGGALPVMPPLDSHAEWRAGDVWPGAFVRSGDFRHRQEEPGRASAWVRPHHPVLAGERVSPTARALGVVDLANGMSPRVPVGDAFFPNVDLTAHLFREPDEGWIGLDTTVTFGANGVGVTHSVLNDSSGPFGTSVQSLTVRPALSGA